MKEFGIYIHIPFCVKKCYYCDFVSYANKEELIKDYVQALKKEIKIIGKERNFPKITTIYIGGGTPSFIDSKYIIDIIRTIKEVYDIKKDVEITIELNPGTITKQKLEDYIEVGINRLSIGLQSTDNNLLKQIGRIHTYEQFLENYKLARKIGFKNINVDLMLALPNQTIEILEDSINKLIKLQPEHISVYSLIIEENTKLYDLIENRKMEFVEEDIEREMYWHVKTKLEKDGYEQYEISNFAKIEYESKHNMNCWNQEEYIGFGVAAHSYVGNIRYSNTCNLRKYIKVLSKTSNIKEYTKYLSNLLKIKENVDIAKLNCDDTNTLATIHEIQNLFDKEKEYMMLGLRKIEGVSIQKFKNKFTENPLYLFRKELNKLVQEKLIQVDGDIIRLTNKGLDLANIVWEEFV